MSGGNGNKGLLSRAEEGVLFRKYSENSFRVHVPVYGKSGVACENRLELYDFPTGRNSRVEEIVKGLKHFGEFDYVSRHVVDGHKNIAIGARDNGGELRIRGRIRAEQKVFYRNDRALGIRNKIIEDNIGLMHFALRQRGGAIELNTYEDYFQEMFFCFDRVIDAFDVRKGNRFSSYAMSAFFREISCLRNKEYSIFSQAFSKGGDEMCEEIADPASVDKVLDFDRKEILNLLKDDRERNILDMRTQGMTLKEVSKEFGLSREWVRQIQKKALVKLRKELESDDFSEAD